MSGARPIPATLRWRGGASGYLEILDQRLLPQREAMRALRTAPEVWEAIHTLAVRGAPAIGIAAAFGFVLGMRAERKIGIYEAGVKDLAAYLCSSRPTAVNLSWAIQRMLATSLASIRRKEPATRLLKRLLREASAIHREDARACQRMGAHGAKLLPRQATVLTHCNAGRLATGGLGTALAVVYAAKKSGKKLRVFAGETRPLFQGARLTSWELQRSGVKTTLLCDGAAGSLLAKGEIDAVLVGADRIAANGDFANKVGTYGLAVLAARHRVPLYVVAPRSTFDLSLRSGKSIPIEQRGGEEVTEPLGVAAAPKGVGAYNPAFDLTPAELVTAIVTEAGIVRRPSQKKIQKLFRKNADKG